jgi:hypothetical protein
MGYARPSGLRTWEIRYGAALRHIPEEVEKLRFQAIPRFMLAGGARRMEALAYASRSTVPTCARECQAARDWVTLVRPPRLTPMRAAVVQPLGEGSAEKLPHPIQPQ